MPADRIRSIAGRVLVDTNVLIYATLSADPRQARARSVLEQRLRPDVEMFISVQNLAEMYPNLTGPKNQPPDSPALARDKIRSIARLRGVTVLPTTLDTALRALDVCAANGLTRQSYFDAQLAALMLQEGIPTVVTENVADFTRFKGVRALNPFA
jgi:predicted nucleic acid-binding protein